MTTTDLITLLQSIEKGISGRSREITIYGKSGREMLGCDEHLVLESSGDGCGGAEVSFGVRKVKPKNNDTLLLLLKDLPNCKKGRFFKEDIDGDFFHSMTDEEVMAGELKGYNFTREEVFTNMEYFKVIDKK
jgi:hypothetical protein